MSIIAWDFIILATMYDKLANYKIKNNNIKESLRYKMRAKEFYSKAKE